MEWREKATKGGDINADSVAQLCRNGNSTKGILSKFGAWNCSISDILANKKYIIIYYDVVNGNYRNWRSWYRYHELEWSRTTYLRLLACTIFSG